MRLATFAVNAFDFLVLRVIARKLVTDCLPVASNDCTYLFKMGMHAAEAIFATAEWNLAVVDTATRVTDAYPVGNNSRGFSINCNIYVCISGRFDGKGWFFNSSIAEQTNVWLGGYHAICWEMLVDKYDFFLDQMILHRNCITKAKLETQGHCPGNWPLVYDT